ncbi:MAG TPA: nitroreductase family deazaflavin-dependent oxidoreductase [Thermomicrobiales bacterium]|nr:nitroreductase family deazaflavin-dependent oxidoreductase [Thermomicrobiales bacterium]
MPAPRWLARANRRVTNPILGRVVRHLPGFGIVVHTGRRSGRQYRTPVGIFAHDGGYVIALTYGPETEWVRNVLASGGCTVEQRGRTLHLAQPRLFHDEDRRAVPAPVRFVLGLIRVNDFLELKRDHDAARSPS